MFLNNIGWEFPGINIKFPTPCSVGGWVFVLDVTRAALVELGNSIRMRT